MRLAEGIVIDLEETFGVLKFSGQRRERFVQDEDGNRTDDVKERTYDLKSMKQDDDPSFNSGRGWGQGL